MKKEITVIVNKLSTEVDNFNYAIFEDKHEELIKQLIEVSEKFAIRFMEWTHNLRDSKEDSIEFNQWINISNEELLEMFKKEIEND